jgi:hypothetical protein
VVVDVEDGNWCIGLYGALAGCETHGA